mgnify:CR=1 FL=1
MKSRQYQLWWKPDTACVVDVKQAVTSGITALQSMQQDQRIKKLILALQGVLNHLRDNPCAQYCSVILDGDTIVTVNETASGAYGNKEFQGMVEISGKTKKTTGGTGRVACF